MSIADAVSRVLWRAKPPHLGKHMENSSIDGKTVVHSSPVVFLPALLPSHQGQITDVIVPCTSFISDLLWTGSPRVGLDLSGVLRYLGQCRPKIGTVHIVYEEVCSV